jgi:hypothetical protein
VLDHPFESIHDTRYPALQVAQRREDLVIMVGLEASQDVHDRSYHMHGRAKSLLLLFATVRDFCRARERSSLV